jgi:hypothetical protein
VSLEDVTQLKSIYFLFKSRCDHFDEVDFFAGLFSGPDLDVTLQAFNGIVQDFVSKATIDTFHATPICTAMRMLLKSTPESRDGWKESIYRLLALMPDLHTSKMMTGGTILDQIFDIAESPFESQEVGEEWLSLLEGVGIEVEDYLRIERGYQYELGSVPILTPGYGFALSNDMHQYGFDVSNASRYHYVMFSESRPRISWDWYIDPHSGAVDVLYEFRHFGPVNHEPRQDYHCPERLANWPYFYPRWLSCCHTVTKYTSKETKNSLVELFETRFERRWLKKVEKFHRGKRSENGKAPKVPGAWID